MSRTDPQCGNCGKPQSQHFKEIDSEELIYCNKNTNEEFSKVPNAQVLLDFMSKNLPATVELSIELWQRANGHIQ